METRHVTEYVAYDGTTFRNAEDCAKHENLKLRVDDAIRMLPKPPSGHGTFISVPSHALNYVRERLFAIVLKEFGDEYPQWKTVAANEVNPFSVVGRVLGDCGGPLADGWRRLMNCDFERGRIYDQPYFVDHPDEAKEAAP